MEARNQEEWKRLPMLPLRGICALPGMVVHFDVSRELSIKAIEKALAGNQEIFLTMQKDEQTEEPVMEDLYSMGVIGVVRQLVKLPDDLVRILVEVKERSWLEKIEPKEGILYAHVRLIEPPEDDLKDSMREAMIGVAKELLQRYIVYHGKINPTALKQLVKTKNLYEFLEILSLQLPMNLEQQQDFLNAFDAVSQYELLTKYLADDIEISKVKKNLQEKIKERVDKNQKEYMLREQLKYLRQELGEDEDLQTERDEFLEKTQQLLASEEIKEKIRKEIKRFQRLGVNSSEANVERTYIETLLELPWDKMTEDNLNIVHVKKILEQDHYGLEKVKERILDFLAVKQLFKESKKQEKKSNVLLCLVGPPGTGKTSIARSIARALNREYARICLGGVRDEAEIRGHRKTYIGAMPGRLARALQQTKCKNPLILLDEIDKMGNDIKGDPASALLEVLDAEQNTKFIDHYVELPMDLSQVMFICTANSAQTIPKPLLDRMEVIEVNSYTYNEKWHIAKDYLIEKQLKENGLNKSQLSISKKALEKIIVQYTKEAGVRNLERTIGKLCRKAVREILEENSTKIKVTDKNLKEYLGVEKYTLPKQKKEAQVGLVNGLAWTSVGGVTLQVEVNTMPGKEDILLTGQLGDVMKESARIALTLVRSLVEREAEMSDDYFEKHSVHIHVPEGATPKDGPSAGITMTTAIYSAVTGRAVRGDIAMTGEITLGGKVLPIGGLKEKMLAAKMAGMKTVLIPWENEKDLEEISDEIKEGLDIIPVKEIKEVMREALV